jgi:hypothetical protein
MRRLVLALVLAAVPAGAAAAPAAALEVRVDCFAPAATRCGGWHNTNVRVDWTVNPPSAAKPGTCVDEVINWETAGTRRGCEAVEGDDRIVREVVVRVDKTAPLLTGAAPDRAPDANGWYRAPVGVTFRGTDATSGMLACTATTYAGPDSAAAGVAGVCRDRAGNEAAGSFALSYDATPPTVTGITADRRPDHRGWYVRPIGFTVTGADALSGLAGCDPALHAGPDGAAAPLLTTCRDNAGNVATRAFGVPFDATAPALRKVKTRLGDRVVRLDWAAADAERVHVRREPGRGGAARTVLHDGGGTRLTDRDVTNGRRYEYRIKAVDQAGNESARTVVVVPGPRLIAPPPRARLSEPPLLRWTPVRGAQYYNVQLFRGDRKILSAWPTRARLQLRPSWRYRGKQRLKPGRYRWYVWPGRGPRSLDVYGPRIGGRSFVFEP